MSEYEGLPTQLAAELIQPTGRPHIPWAQIAIIYSAFERGGRTAEAAAVAGVHRNTALNYYGHFRRYAHFHPILPLPPPELPNRQMIGPWYEACW